MPKSPAAFPAARPSDRKRASNGSRPQAESPTVISTEASASRGIGLGSWFENRTLISFEVSQAKRSRAKMLRKIQIARRPTRPRPVGASPRANFCQRGAAARQHPPAACRGLEIDRGVAEPRPCRSFRANGRVRPSCEVARWEIGTQSACWATRSSLCRRLSRAPWGTFPTCRWVAGTLETCPTLG